ncbi:hypothetical protein [Deinococcus soli (ex Cha et al. 2016)]|uniref:Uncharacterized protein n=2 Tax=Deinococcus soli (ex Cha et al. 2016) TaxID=1309411 RepID=A0AAE3XD22_9DEIO|nr:hypothetical protein [Deinococcus soli (ex Cha et al. 2016)]MDR6218714.1 hypothetical protein [Deinococcus soli (ex Cha et al. 2016)]MDR6328511.1 hypothetical protein [Deinococcus soli (ex Cha et al. 2016)]MDR6753122.1 hypothetical protein [Deinococcus soli (ex Cha et al. 2016)]
MTNMKRPRRWIRDGQVAVVTSWEEHCWATNHDAAEAGVDLAALTLHPDVAQVLVSAEEAQEAIVTAWADAGADDAAWAVRERAEAALRDQSQADITRILERDWPGLSALRGPHTLRVGWVPVGATFRVTSEYRMGEMLEVLDLSTWLTA